MTRIVLITLCLCTLLRADPVDDLVNAEMKKRGIPGVALGVVHKGKVVKLAGYGLADVEHNIPATPQTPFQIQSITKTFMASAIMMLELDSKLSVDDLVSKHLGGTPDSWKEITLRHLLSHTSGIKDFINEPTASLRIEITEEQVFADTVKRPLNFEPGTRYAYSNTNFHLLAMIVRKYTGKNYGQMLQERIFEPTGMKSSRLLSWTDIIPNRARGYRKGSLGGLRNGDFVAESILAYGGGGIVSNVEDMVKWDIALRDEKLLKKPVLEKMWTAAKLKDGKAIGYGLGWGVAGTPGHRAVMHTGGHVTGFATLHARLLDDDLSVIVLTNLGGADVGRISRLISAHYVPALKPPTLAPIEDKEPEVAKRSRQIIDELAAGKIEADRYTPEMKKVLDTNLPQVRGLTDTAGAISKVELLKREELKDDLKRYVYRVSCEKSVLVLTLVYNKDQKVSGLWVNEE